jgi:hypothetical protein
MGHPPDTLLHVRHEGKPHDPTMILQPIGELAKWTIEESNRGGLKRRVWRPYSGPQLVDIAASADADLRGGIIPL